LSRALAAQPGALGIDHVGLDVAGEIAGVQRVASLAHHCMERNKVFLQTQDITHIVAKNQIQASRLATFFQTNQFQIAA
jgi:hypothetical protein